MTEQIEEKNMRLMQTLDDAWNSQDWDTFSQRHTDDCAIFWPGQPEPTKGVHNHKAEGIEFFKTFPDNHVGNWPYKIFFAQGDYTCSVADFTGTCKGPMKMGDKTVQPSGKSFRVEFCTIALWKDGKIAEERLFYDQVGLMKQIGLT